MMNNPIGVLINYAKGMDLVAKFREAQEMEMASCQLCIWDESLYTDDNAEKGD